MSEERASGWAAVGAGMRTVGRVAGRAAVTVGRSIASAYQAIDPDVRRHIAELPLVGLTYLAPRRPPVAALPDDGHRPVIFIHGLGGSPGNFFPMRAWFTLHGRRRTYSLGLPDGESIADLGPRLSAFVEEVIVVNRLQLHEKIDLVAHSMGGLVARIALEDEKTRARIGTLVTLGTPHAGTYAARFGATDRVLDLRPDSPLMERLTKQLPWKGPRLVAFWSHADMMVLPASSATVEGAENREIPTVTHTGYLISPRVFREVTEVLEDLD
jgi:triacylglycerol esterase/lipase EstA (alpha/beta hydrolase family)